PGSPKQRGTVKSSRSPSLTSPATPIVSTPSPATTSSTIPTASSSPGSAPTPIQNHPFGRTRHEHHHHPFTRSPAPSTSVIPTVVALDAHRARLSRGGRDRPSRRRTG